MQVAIIKYNAGNVQSVSFALNRLGITPEVTDDPEKIMKADKVIFPGVGEASSAMHYLRSRKLDQVLSSLSQPVLGICLGLQLMCRHSEEGDVACMGIFDATVKRFAPGLKVPHMGWNNMISCSDDPLFRNLPDHVYLYYVHSYYATLGEDTIASTAYINSFSAALRKGNFYAIQAHAEKSGEAGELILKNFLQL